MVETSQGRSRPAHSIERPAGIGWPGWAPASGIVFAFEFFPVLAPLIWVVTVSIVLIRRPVLARQA
jgi:hypothetical protein